MSDFIPVNVPRFVGNELAYLSECIDSGWVSSEGRFVGAFETGMANLMGRKFAVAVQNGSNALDISIAALNIGPGDEVIVPSFTIISCVLQILRVGAVPVFVDSDVDTWNMDVSQVHDNISSKTKAVIAPHIYGLPIDMDPLVSICNEHGICLIEDAAEVIGQTYQGRPCGSFGKLSTVSFYPNKHITTGEGGMVLTDDPSIAEKLRSLRDLCHSPERRFKHYELGWNMRMSNLQAAVGLAQLEGLPDSIIRKRQIGMFYSEKFQDLSSVNLPIVHTDYADNIFWVYGMVLKEPTSRSVTDIIDKLNRCGIGCRPFFFPLHQQPLMDKYLFRGKSLVVSEYLGSHGFYIPSGLGLTDRDMEYVAANVRNILS